MKKRKLPRTTTITDEITSEKLKVKRQRERDRERENDHVSILNIYKIESTLSLSSG